MARSRLWLILAGLFLALIAQATAFTTACKNTDTQAVIDYGIWRYSDERDTTISDALSARKALLEIQERDSRCDSLTSVTFEGNGPSVNGTEIEAALRSLPVSLEDIHWDIKMPIPATTLQVIEDHHPSARLHYSMPFHNWERIDRSEWKMWHTNRRMPLLRSILGSPNLYVLKAELYYGAEDLPDDLPLVHEVLTTCNHLRELDLSIRYTGGCTPATWPQAFAFQKNPNPLPPLEVLKISGMYNLESLWKSDRQSFFMARPSTYMYNPWSWLPDDFLDIIWNGVDFLGGVNTTAYDEATQIYTAGGKSPPTLISTTPLGLQACGADLHPQVPRYLLTFNSFLGRLRTPEEATNLDAWMTKMDWSGLRVLHLDSAEQRTLETLGPVLENLTELKLGSGSANAAAVFPTFLRNLATPLTRLELSNYDFQDNYTALIDALGETSGAHLTHLSITEHQWHQHRYCMYNKDRCTERQTEYYLDRPYLNATHLAQLATTTPNITHLDLDISRVASNTTDPSRWTLDYDTIQAAASLPQLRNLTLRLVSPDHFAHLAGMNPRYSAYGPSHTHFKEPSFNRTSVPALYANLNQYRANSGQRALAQLEIKTGLWDQRDQGDWGMMGAPDELVGSWVCKSEGRSKESGPCFGGNSGIDYYHGVINDPYLEDWSQPDQKAKRWWERLEHDEL